MGNLPVQIFLFQNIIGHADIGVFLPCAFYRSGFHRKTGQILAVCHKVMQFAAKRILRLKTVLCGFISSRENIADVPSAQILFKFQLLFGGGVSIGNYTCAVKYKDHFQRILNRECVPFTPFHSVPPPNSPNISRGSKNHHKSLLPTIFL